MYEFRFRKCSNHHYFGLWDYIAFHSGQHDVHSKIMGLYFTCVLQQQWARYLIPQRSAYYWVLGGILLIGVREVERRFGSNKYLSFLLMSVAVQCIGQTAMIATMHLDSSAFSIFAFAFSSFYEYGNGWRYWCCAFLTVDGFILFRL